MMRPSGVSRQLVGTYPAVGVVHGTLVARSSVLCRRHAVYIETHKLIAALSGSPALHTAFSSLESASNPFAQMVDPGRVFAAVHRSERLNALASHVFRPLAWPGSSDHHETHDADIDD